MRTTLIVLGLLTLSSSAFSQRIISPEVQSDGRVTFRVKAQNAKEVRVQCEGVKDGTMQKDDQGVWSMTTPALEPDIYSYSFLVDGFRSLDPDNSLLKYNLLSSDSQLHVPG